MIFQENYVPNFTQTGILPQKQEKIETISKKTGTMSKNRKKQEFGQKNRNALCLPKIFTLLKSIKAWAAALWKKKNL